MGASEDDTDTDNKESDSETDLQESITGSSPESATGDDCLTCLDTEDATVKSACKKFHERVWASCSPTKQGLWKSAQLEQIRNNCNTMWGSDYETIKTEWDLTFDKDPSSFHVSKMVVCTNHLLRIKVATNMRNIYTQEHVANIGRKKKALVWSLKQFHTCYYQLYGKGMTCAMVGLQGLHQGNTLKCPSISAGVGLKLF